MTTSLKPRLSLDAQKLRASRSKRSRKEALLTLGLGIIVFACWLLSLMFGESFYSISEITRVIAGDVVPGASYTVGELRLPRATLALLAGAAFGASGVCFQTMLRNQLASPDIIGISSGASAAGVVCIVGFHMSQGKVSVIAFVVSLLVAATIYWLSQAGQFSGTRLILMGIGVAAMLQSVVTYTLSTAAVWDLGAATRWLTGSLNGATWERVLPVAVTCAIGLPLLVVLSHQLSTVRMGDELAIGLGLRPQYVRIAVALTAVALIAVATAACGPIAFVAFMSGPVASRVVGSRSLIISSALVGALLILVADFAGQFWLGTKYPVGVITGVLGAPYLVYLLITTNRKGETL